MYSEMPTQSDSAVSALIILLFYLIVILLSSGYAIAMYILQSVSLHSISKRRGIKHSWLSWLPVGNVWIFGCISDQYQYVVKNRVKNKRKALLILNIIFILVYLVFWVVWGVMMFSVISMATKTGNLDSAMGMYFGTICIMLIVSLVMSALSIAMCVILYMAQYDLFASCNPDYAVVFLLLTILLGIGPILLFICRKKDLGMPPRKEEVPEEPVPVQETVAQQPWQVVDGE